jgi:hypothetical protein
MDTPPTFFFHYNTANIHISSENAKSPSIVFPCGTRLCGASKAHFSAKNAHNTHLEHQKVRQSPPRWAFGGLTGHKPCCTSHFRVLPI